MPRRLLISVASALVLTLCGGAVAHADFRLLRDERGDVWVLDTGPGRERQRAPARRRGDLVRSLIRHTREHVVVRAYFAGLDRRGRGYALTTRLRTESVPLRLLLLQTPVHRRGIGGRARVKMVRPDGTTVRGCPVGYRIDYAADLVVVRVLRGCLDDPLWVQASVTAVSFGRKDTFADDAHHDGPSMRPFDFTSRIRAGAADRPAREPAEPPPSSPSPAAEGSLPEVAPVRCPHATVTVSTAAGLEHALTGAAPGDAIKLVDSVYAGNFVTTASGTPQQPIFLCGGPSAVLDGGGIGHGYVFHLNGTSHWRLVGFKVRNGQKGVMADGTVDSVIQGLTVSRIGDEAIHLRSNSTDNLVLDNTIRDTGLRRDDFGEGVYVGSAVSNWCTYTDCQPDRSDRNVIAQNTITATTAEAVDIKEATTGGLLRGNTFDGSAMTGADSWVDVKGNNWQVKNNTGTHSPMDGFQTHQVLEGWGDHNIFRDNTARVHGPGLGFAIWPKASNVVTCDNQVEAAGEGFSNLTCTALSTVTGSERRAGGSKRPLHRPGFSGD